MGGTWSGRTIFVLRDALRQPDVKISNANIHDAEAIAAIWNPLIRDTTITFNNVEKSAESLHDMIMERQAAGYAFLLAQEDGQLVGFATYGQFRAGVGYAQTMEHTVALSDAAKGRGVAAALLDALEIHAKARGVHSMLAGISADNIAAVKFHAKAGYSQVGVIPQAGRKFDRWLDLILLQKIL